MRTNSESSKLSFFPAQPTWTTVQLCWHSPASPTSRARSWTPQLVSTPLPPPFPPTWRIGSPTSPPGRLSTRWPLWMPLSYCKSPSSVSRCQVTVQFFGGCPIAYWTFGILPEAEVVRVMNPLLPSIAAKNFELVGLITAVVTASNFQCSI